MAVNSVGTKVTGNEKSQSPIRPNSVSIDPKPSSEATEDKGLPKKGDTAGVAAKPKPEGQTTNIGTTKPKKTADRSVPQARTSSNPGKPSTVIEEKKIDPLANVRLTIKLKKGIVIELPMNQVQKFGVDNGILTVININGTISKFSLLEVDRVTIQ